MDDLLRPSYASCGLWLFDLLDKEILGLTRFGVEVEDTPGSVTITLPYLRRLSNLFHHLEDCRGFKKQLGKGKGEAKLIVNSEKKGRMVYNAKEEILRAKFFMDTGIRLGLVRISPQWIEDARLNHRVTTISLIPHWQKPALDLMNFSKNCDLSNFSLFLEKFQKSQFLLGNVLPPLTPDLINFSKNFDFFNFSQFLEKLQKSQFLLGTPLPPLTLDLINFSKNFDFSNFLQVLEKSRKLQKSQFLLGTLVPPLPLEFSNFSKSAITPIFRNFCYCVQTWTYRA